MFNCILWWLGNCLQLFCSRTPKGGGMFKIKLDSEFGLRQSFFQAEE
jgi:hypothetical protein